MNILGLSKVLRLYIVEGAILVNDMRDHDRKQHVAIVRGLVILIVQLPTDGNLRLMVPKQDNLSSRLFLVYKDNEDHLHLSGYN